MKKMITKVIAPNMEFPEGPEVAVIHVDQSLKEMVEKMGRLAREQDLLYVSVQDSTPEFFMRDEAAEGLVPREPRNREETDLCDVDSLTLHVDKHEVWWSGYISIPSILIETTPIPLAAFGEEE